MNMITVLIVALVLGAYFYPACPKMLKDNKQMLLGVFVGLLAGQYLGVKIEGMALQGGTEVAAEVDVVTMDECREEAINKLRAGKNPNVSLKISDDKHLLTCWDTYGLNMEEARVYSCPEGTWTKISSPEEEEAYECQ